MEILSFQRMTVHFQIWYVFGGQRFGHRSISMQCWASTLAANCRNTWSEKGGCPVSQPFCVVFSPLGKQT